MPVQKLTECWNCGWSYNPDNNEVCPKCKAHPDEEEEDLGNFDEE